jgi:hypothetical protein
LDVGFIARSTVNRSLTAGDVCQNDVKTFYNGVKTFFTTAFKYALNHMPVDDPVLQNAQFIQFDNRYNCTVDMPLYFVQR